MSQVPKKVIRKHKPAELAPPPKDKCNVSQAEVIEVNERSGHLLLQNSSSGEKQTIYHSLVIDEQGRALTDTRNIKGRVIVVFKYPSHTDYFLRSKAEGSSHSDEL